MLHTGCSTPGLYGPARRELQRRDDVSVVVIQDPLNILYAISPSRLDTIDNGSTRRYTIRLLDVFTFTQPPAADTEEFVVQVIGRIGVNRYVLEDHRCLAKPVTD